jgi:hypothetical protein
VGKIEIAGRSLGAVVPDGFDGAAFLGFFATGFLLGGLRLFEHKRVTAVLVAFEIVRRGLATQIAINALIIDVVFASDILGVFICDVCHKSLKLSCGRNMAAT